MSEDNYRLVVIVLMIVTIFVTILVS